MTNTIDECDRRTDRRDCDGSSSVLRCALKMWQLHMDCHSKPPKARAIVFLSALDCQNLLNQGCNLRRKLHSIYSVPSYIRFSISMPKLLVICWSRVEICLGVLKMTAVYGLILFVIRYICRQCRRNDKLIARVYTIYRCIRAADNCRPSLSRADMSRPWIRRLG